VTEDHGGKHGTSGDDGETTDDDRRFLESFRLR
jgi:hypothetical protein